MTKTSKDHYVPQFYLDAFACEGPGFKTPHIWQYDVEQVVSPRIKDVASEKNYYSFKNKETGEKDRTIDDLFTQIEGWAAPIIQKIINEETSNLLDEEIEKLSIFLAFLVVRTPGFQKHLESLEEEMTKELMALSASDSENFHKKCLELNIAFDENKIEELRQSIIGKKYRIGFGNKGYFMAHGLKHAQDLVEIFYGMKQWHLVKSKKEQIFVTSDHPVSLYRARHVPFQLGGGYMHGTIFLPISPHHGLLLRDVSLEKTEIAIDAKKINEINMNTMRHADNYIYANIKSKKIHNTFKLTGSKRFQKIRVSRHEFAPYVFMGPENQIPIDPFF